MGAMEIIKMTFEEAIDICRKKILIPPVTKEAKEAWARVSSAALTLYKMSPGLMKGIEAALNRGEFAIGDKRRGSA
jgi:hypothetical protein